MFSKNKVVVSSKKKSVILVIQKHTLFETSLSNMHTFLSCDTRSNNVCLNRTEGVPQVVSSMLKDPIAIDKRVGCASAPPSAVATRRMPMASSHSSTAAAVPKGGPKDAREKFMSLYPEEENFEDGDDEYDEENFEDIIEDIVY